MLQDAKAHATQQHLGMHKARHQIEYLSGSVLGEPACDWVRQGPTVDVRLGQDFVQPCRQSIPPMGAHAVGQFSAGEIQVPHDRYPASQGCKDEAEASTAVL